MIAEITISGVSLVAGAFFGLWLGEYVKRPKLIIGGSGGGAVHVPGFRIYSVTVANAPGFIGLNIGKTVVFGRSFIQARQLGTFFDRRPSRCTASLHEAKDRSGVGLVVTNNQGVSDGMPVVPTGGHANVYLFARLEAVPDKFFIYQATSAADPTPVVPEPHRQWSEKDFILRINSDRGTEVEMPVQVHLHLQGTLWISAAGGGSAF